MTETEGDAYHEVSWTDARVRRFWNWPGAHEAADSTWFSRRFARRIVFRIVQYFVRDVQLCAQRLGERCCAAILRAQ